MTTLTLTPGAVTLDDLSKIFWNEASVQLDPACHPAIELAHARIAKAVAGTDAVYGVNTGFGKLASVKIESKDTATLQRNLILSHCCGVGPAIPRRHARMLMALKLLSLGRGASGVRLAVVTLIEGMHAKGVTPVIPAQGSVGASGDLARLAHMAAVMMGHAGQIEAGATMRALLDGSEIRDSHMVDDARVQDPYCIRCQPQVTGAAMDVCAWPRGRWRLRRMPPQITLWS